MFNRVGRHRRNFVEACLCDGAIVLGYGSAGTASEALFCLYLGRPVVVVGAVGENAVRPSSLYQSAKDRIECPTTSDLAVDRGIAGAYVWAVAAESGAEVRPLPRDDAAAKKVVTALLNRIGRRRSPRLDIDNTIDESQWGAYVGTCMPKAQK